MSDERLTSAYQDLIKAQSAHNEAAVKATRAELREARVNLLQESGPEAVANTEKETRKSVLDPIRLQELHNKAKALDALCEAKGIFGPR